MRIIGGSDYYDSAAAYGIDTDIVFVRHKDKRITDAEIPFPYVRSAISNLGYSGTAHSASLYPYYIIVAGNIWPLIEIRFTTDYRPEESIYCYSNISLHQNLSKLFKYEEPRRYKYSINDIDDTREFFNVKLTDRQKQWLIKNKITIIHNVYTGNTESYEFIGKLREYRRLRKQEWLINSFDLHSFQFQRMVDPYTMHQEIAMYVGGVLASSGNLMVEITDDKIKIHKAGFDKFSFRKMKSV